MYLKHKTTGIIGQYANFQGDDWEVLSDSEITAYELSIAKSNKLNQLATNRENYCLTPITYNGNDYIVSEEAKTAINYYVASLSTLATTGPYYTSLGQKVELSKADFKTIAGLIQTREIESRDKKIVLIEQINNCISLEELEAIDITFN